MKREAYSAELNPELVTAVCAYQAARRYMQWLLVALSYRHDAGEYADVVERTVRRHRRSSAAAGGGAA